MASSRLSREYLGSENRLLNKSFFKKKKIPCIKSSHQLPVNKFLLGSLKAPCKPYAFQDKESKSTVLLTCCSSESGHVAEGPRISLSPQCSPRLLIPYTTALPPIITSLLWCQIKSTSYKKVRGYGGDMEEQIENLSTAFHILNILQIKPKIQLYQLLLYIFILKIPFEYRRLV